MEEILRKLNSIKLTLMAHPDFQMNDDGEFHDQIESIEEIETELKNIAVLDVVRPSLLDNVKEIAFGDGSAQERMGEIKALFSNEA